MKMGFLTLLLFVAGVIAKAEPELLASHISFLGHSQVGTAANWAQLEWLHEQWNHQEPVQVWDDSNRLPVGVEIAVASIWVLMLFSVPIVLRLLDGRPMTKTQVATGVAFWIAVIGGLVLFTNIILFSSIHFDQVRPLSIIECIYLMSQVITTVGYGDITPAKPRGQVFVGLYVLMSLFVIAMLVSDLVAHVMDHAQKYHQKLASKVTQRVEEEEEKAEEEAAAAAEENAATPSESPTEPKKNRPKGKALERQRTKAAEELLQKIEKPSFGPLVGSLSCFAFFAITWIFFFHFYPGEGKTWLQAIYMSVITLSTVGFGAFTPNTEGGKVFAAFWMIFGSAALVSVVTSFTELTMKFNEYERFDTQKGKKALIVYKEEKGTNEMEESEFLKFGLVQRGLISAEDFVAIQTTFQEIAKKSDGRRLTVSLTDLEEELAAETTAEPTPR